MGSSLTGQQIKNTYKSLIKTSDSTEASATAKLLSDGNGNDFGVYIDTDGVFGIGSAPSYSLDVSSRTDGVALPVGTTANRPTPTNGLLRYNSTIGKIEFYDGGWKTVFTTSGGTIDGSLIVTGDLTIQGTTVTLNTETVQFEDNILLLNRADSDTQYDAVNAGIEIEKTSGTNPSFLYTYSTSTWGLTDSLTVEGNLTVDTNTLYVDSTNNRVGIGTLDPVATLHVSVNSGVSTIKAHADHNSSPVASLELQRGTNDVWGADAFGDWRMSNSVANLLFEYGEDGSTNTRMVIDSSGRVGIGVTPNAWSSPNFVVQQIGVGASIAGRGSAGTGDQIYISANTYYDGTTWRYIETNPASNYYQDNGEHVWRTAVNGSAGVPTTFSERMRLYNGGDISFRDGSAGEAFYWDASAASLSIGAGSAPIDRVHVVGGFTSTGLSVPTNTNVGSVQLGYDGTNGVLRTWNSSPIQLSTYGHIQFDTSGTERLRIDSSGNVGIGISSGMTYPLTIQAASGNNSYVHFVNSTTGTAYSDGFQIGVADNSSDAILLQRESAPMKFYTAGTERMRLHSGGDISFRDTSANEAFYWDASTARLGIGAGSSPTETLEVKGNIKLGDGGQRNIIGPTNNSIGIFANPNAPTEGIIFSTDGGTTTEMFIQDGGNVGIGTSSPNSYSNLKALTINGLSGSLIDLEVNGTLKGEVFASTSNLNINAYDAHNIAFTTGAGTERMRIESSGNVLINNSSNRIGERLNVTGSGILIEQTDGGIATMLGAFGSSDVILGAFSNNDVQLRTNNISRMRITSGGNVLIGTTSDFGGKLNIGGADDSIITRGATSTNSGTWVMQRGDTGADVWQISTNASNFYIADADFSHYAFLSQNPTSWSFASDERLKENIVNIDYGLSTILELSPRRFTFKSSQKNSIGFIAQELKPIIPEAVIGEEKEILDTDTNEDIAKKILGVSPDTLIPILVKAMQEQQEIINNLKARIETLENQ